MADELPKFERSDAEKSDLEFVKKIADRWGYGNCIQFLQHEWKDILVNDGIVPAAAEKAVGLTS